MLRKLNQGFTLIELMIVVAIIGILAAIAIPNFVKFQCRSKQSEAKGNLKAIYVAEESYRAERDHYVNGSDGALKTTGQALNDSKSRSHSFNFDFIQGQVDGPILGIDFMRRFKMMVDPSADLCPPRQRDSLPWFPLHLPQQHDPLCHPQ